jgi:hypothetical protein
MVTVTSTVPVPAGKTAEMEVELFTVKLTAGIVPKFTAVAPVKFVPPMVTVVPLPDFPELGLTDVTVGTSSTYKPALAAIESDPTTSSVTPSV